MWSINVEINGQLCLAGGFLNLDIREQEMKTRYIDWGQALLYHFLPSRAWPAEELCDPFNDDDDGTRCTDYIIELEIHDCICLYS